MDFSKFGVKVTQRFNELARAGELYQVKFRDVSKKREDGTIMGDGDLLWQSYLDAFPEGTNPIFRERTEHDCSCCRNFVKNIGRVVAIIDGKLTSVWSLKGLEYPYNEIAEELDEIVTKAEIESVWRTREPSYGAQFTIEHLEGSETRRWNHFHGTVPHFARTMDAAAEMGVKLTLAGLLRRGLTELTLDALTTVKDLASDKDGALYRGAEKLPLLTEFIKLKTKADKITDPTELSVFVWQHVGSHVARFKNDVIGTLVSDLSEGKDLEEAVRMYESKVAPTNYKRPKALVTPGMVKEAMKTITELDLEPALERRFAKLSDISVNNVLWVSNAARSQMKGGVEALLSSGMQLAKPRSEEAEDISVDDFMARIVPKATDMELFVRNSQIPNFVSLTAPVHDDVYRLFKWNNDFAWSYMGGVTDSIREKVKRAGGNVTNAALRVSLAWHNADDLDIHGYEPSGRHIWFRERYGILDVDTNGMDRQNHVDPVENLSWTFDKLYDGVYKIDVHQYGQRSTNNQGFELEIESQGKILSYSHNGSPRTGEVITCFKIIIKNGVVQQVDFNKVLEAGGTGKEHWGVQTESFVPVSTLMKSPNHWDGNEIGNKHWFFILDGCKNDEPVRGIYNEFLNSRLEKHRRAFELLGSKTLCKPSKEQLSGVGFSSTRGDQVVVRVTGQKSKKTFNIIF